MSDFDLRSSASEPKKWVITAATVLWLTSALVLIGFQFDDLPIFARIVFGVLTLLSLGMAILAPPAIRCAAFRYGARTDPR